MVLIVARSWVQTQVGHGENRKHCQPISKWVPVLDQRRIKQGKERDGLLTSL